MVCNIDTREYRANSDDTIIFKNVAFDDTPDMRSQLKGRGIPHTIDVHESGISLLVIEIHGGLNSNAYAPTIFYPHSQFYSKTVQY